MLSTNAASIQKKMPKQFPILLENLNKIIKRRTIKLQDIDLPFHIFVLGVRFSLFEV